MFISITKELLGTKTAECDKIFLSNINLMTSMKAAKIKEVPGKFLSGTKYTAM